jgi:hypothetical protein
MCDGRQLVGKPIVDRSRIRRGLRIGQLDEVTLTDECLTVGKSARCQGQQPRVRSTVIFVALVLRLISRLIHVHTQPFKTGRERGHGAGENPDDHRRTPFGTLAKRVEGSSPLAGSNPAASALTTAQRPRRSAGPRPHRVCGARRRGLHLLLPTAAARSPTVGSVSAFGRGAPRGSSSSYVALPCLCHDRRPRLAVRYSR